MRSSQLLSSNSTTNQWSFTFQTISKWIISSHGRLPGGFRQSEQNFDNINSASFWLGSGCPTPILDIGFSFSSPSLGQHDVVFLLRLFKKEISFPRPGHRVVVVHLDLGNEKAYVSHWLWQSRRKRSTLIWISSFNSLTSTSTIKKRMSCLDLDVKKECPALIQTIHLLMSHIDLDNE